MLQSLSSICRLFFFRLLPLVLLATSSKPLGKLYTAAYLPGEQLEYRVHYGFFNAGTAYMRVTDKYYLVNNKVCFRAEIIGNSTWAFDQIVKIRDVWGTYFDTVNFQPQKSFRSIRENRYRKREETFFDYSKNIAKVVAENDTPKIVKVLPNVQDIVSGYYFLRLQNYEGIKKNDTLRLNGIFEDKFYNFKILYLGKTRIKTKFGRTDCFLISPIMPENKLFKGKNPIKMWISDDKNRIPMKVEAELILGAAELDLIEYSNLKYPIHFE
jgi:hypothetical protein